MTRLQSPKVIQDYRLKVIQVFKLLVVVNLRRLGHLKKNFTFQIILIYLQATKNFSSKRSSTEKTFAPHTKKWCHLQISTCIFTSLGSVIDSADVGIGNFSKKPRLITTSAVWNT